MTMAPEEPDALKTKPVPVSHWEYEEEGPEADGAAPPEGEPQRKSWAGRHWKSGLAILIVAALVAGGAHCLPDDAFERHAVPDSGGHYQ